MRPHPREADTDPFAPRAWATCDRCGKITNHYKLHWQFDWRGRQTRNIRILVCWRCEDVPQRQLGTIVLPPDPLPIINARPEQYFIDEIPVTTRITVGTGQNKWNHGVRTLVGRFPPYRQRIIVSPVVGRPVPIPNFIDTEDSQDLLTESNDNLLSEP